MKKHNEGYVLAYVMVIILVLLLVALSVMSVALENVQSQKADLEKMRAKYAAQGAVEQTIATLTGLETYTLIEDIPPTGVELRIAEGTLDGKKCNIIITAVCDPIVVTCEMKLESSNEIASSPDGVNITYGLHKLQSLQYVSYHISTVDDTEGGADE